MAESFAPTVLVDGITEGWMWLMAYAQHGCQWAIDALEEPKVKAQIADYPRQCFLRRIIKGRSRKLVTLKD